MTPKERAAYVVKLLMGDHRRYGLLREGPAKTAIEAAIREALAEMGPLHSSEKICEALVRHVETSGSEVFEKNFVKSGCVICTVWCMIGPNAELFRDNAIAWLNDNGFNLD